MLVIIPNVVRIVYSRRPLVVSRIFGKFSIYIGSSVLRRRSLFAYCYRARVLHACAYSLRELLPLRGFSYDMTAARASALATLNVFPGSFAYCCCNQRDNRSADAVRILLAANPTRSRPLLLAGLPQISSFCVAILFFLAIFVSVVGSLVLPSTTKMFNY